MARFISSSSRCSEMFRQLVEQASQSNMASGGAGNLIMLIKEGAAFQDNYQINVGLPKSVDSSLPCIYTNSSTQTLQLNQTDKTRSILLNSNLCNVTSDNKITIEQKPKESTTDNKNFISSPATTDCLNKSVFKKPRNKRILKTHQTHKTGSILLNSNLRNVTSDNQITIERKPKESTTDNKNFISSPATTDCLNKSVFKKPRNKRILKTHQTHKTGSILLNSNLRNVTSDNQITIERKPKESTTDNKNFISSPATTDCLNKSVFKKRPHIPPILRRYQAHKTKSILLNSNLHNVTSGNSLHSVMHAGSDNKITIERKLKESTIDHKTFISLPATTNCLNKAVFKKPFNNCRGCRCGKLSATPGKVTCFGQRCPCYAESKPCMECQCQGCKNPHHPDATKVRTHTPHIEIFQPALFAVFEQEQQLQLQKQPLLQKVIVERVPTLTGEPLSARLLDKDPDIFTSRYISKGWWDN